MLNDRRLSTETEELLGSRNPRSMKRAVRWEDLTSSQFAAVLARAGISGGTGSSGGSSDGAEVPPDLLERLETVEGQVGEALQDANEAADLAQNAQLAADNAHQFADDLVFQARQDLAADYAAAQAAVGQALGYASAAQASSLTAIAGAARLFPPEMAGGKYFTTQLTGAPNTGPDMFAVGSSWTEVDDAAEGKVARALGGAPADLHNVTKHCIPYLTGRTYRITLRAKASAMTTRLRFIVARLDATYGDANNAVVDVGTLTTAWQDYIIEYTLPTLAGRAWARFGVFMDSSRPAGGDVYVSRCQIEDITLSKEASGFASQAGIARDDAVIAKQDSEDAAAAAASSLALTAEVAGQGFSCLNDTFLLSSDWGRWGGQGTRTVLNNTVYPIGRTWQFDVTATQQDGIQLLASPATTWIGQTNANAYVIEVMYTVLSGGLGGAGVRLTWNNSGGTGFGVNMTLADMQAGEGVTGRARVARGVLVKPSNFSGTFVSHHLYAFANYSTLAPMAAKSIQFHRVNIRPATAEEVGQGQVLAGVQAYLAVNYLTSAQTDAAIAAADLTLNASLGPTLASVQQSSTAIASLNGTVARFRNVVTVNGEQRAGIEAVAFSGTGVGTGSVLKLIGDDVVAEGTLSARGLVIHDGSGNMFPDPQFSLLSIAGWTSSASGSIYLVPRRVSTLAAGTIKTNAPAPTVLEALPHGATDPALLGPALPIEPGQMFNLAFDAAVDGGGGHDFRLRLQWLNNLGATMGTAQDCRITTAPEAWQRYSFDTSAAPAGAAAMSIRLFTVGVTTASAFITNFSVIRKRTGATLITPGGITTPLLAAESVTSDKVTTSELITLSSQIGDAIITRSKIGLAEIDEARIEDGAVTNLKVANAAITTLKVAGYAVSTILYSMASGSGVASITLTRNREDPCLIIIDGQWESTFSGAGGVASISSAFTVRRSGSTIWTEQFYGRRNSDGEESGIFSATRNFIIFDNEAPASGSVTYTFEISVSGPGTHLRPRVNIAILNLLR